MLLIVWILLQHECSHWNQMNMYECFEEIRHNQNDKTAQSNTELLNPILNSAIRKSGRNLSSYFFAKQTLLRSNNRNTGFGSNELDHRWKINKSFYFTIWPTSKQSEFTEIVFWTKNEIIMQLNEKPGKRNLLPKKNFPSSTTIEKQFHRLFSFDLSKHSQKIVECRGAGDTF